MIEPFETVSRDDTARPMGRHVALAANRFQVCRVEGSPARTQRLDVVVLHRERAARLAPPANRIENPTVLEVSTGASRRSARCLSSVCPSQALQ